MSELQNHNDIEINEIKGPEKAYLSSILTNTEGLPDMSILSDEVVKELLPVD